MKLRKLTLQGYKTFASKTEFVFDSGITAIVGPNGSGKSNIADALRWVLGEQSFGTLRARRSADMIFAGSQQRARAGMAQATITLDNSDGWLPIDFTEVEIARRSFRSGENEYLINGQQVRLKDVTELLATSGLSERTYTIIGQGLVDQALSLRSDERRILFEEAAGITHYKTRRAETIRRLDETQRNLQRVHDILEELRPRVISLKRQTTRTRNYEQISADLRELLRIWYGYKWEHAKSDMRAASDVAASAESAWAAARDVLLSHQGDIEAVQLRLGEAQQIVAENQTARDRLRQELEASRRKQAVYRERRTTLERQIEEALVELPVLEESAISARVALDAATADLAAAQQELQTHQSHLLEFRITFQGRQDEIAVLQKKVSRLEAERQRGQATLAQAEGQLAQLNMRVEELTTETEPADTSLGTDGLSDESVATLNMAIVAAREETIRLQGARNDENRERAADIGRLKEMRRGAREMEQQLNRLRNDLARQEERVSLLEKQGQREIPLQPEQIVGRLASMVEIPPEHKVAITAVLGERLAAWLVNDSDSLWQAVDKVRDSKGGNQAHLALAVLESSAVGEGNRPDMIGEAGVIGWAADVIKVGRAAPLIKRLLSGVLLVDDAPTAYRIAAGQQPVLMAVAPDGFVVHGGGLVEIGGEAAGNFLAHEARHREATVKLKEIRAAVAEREGATIKQQSDIDSLQERVDEGANEERRLARLEAEVGQRLNVSRNQLENIQRQQEYHSRRQSERAAALERAQAQIAQTGTAIARHTEVLAQVESELAEARAQLQVLPIGDLQQQQQSLRQLLTAAQTILAGRQAVVDSRRSTLNQTEGQLNRVRQRLATQRAQLEDLGQQEDEVEASNLERELVHVESTLAPLMAAMENDRGALARLQQNLAVVQRSAHELETQLTQTRIRQTQFENQIEGLQDRIRADLGLVSLNYDAGQTGAPPLPMHEVVENLNVIAELPADIEENIQLYRGQLQRIGPINPDAPAELAATEERFEFLTLQIDDLTETDAQLRGVIAELDELTSRAFAKTVEQVNGIFDETFQQLFGGGSGRLAMTDPDDPTVSGVEIIARLPNRHEQGLALLSGGERSLTAAALIFSLLKVAPPPFCVLDEVDAALDEANVSRFRDVVRELGRQTQFILITHNRGTVQAADTLYGVSMQPDSSSQVISVKPEEFFRRA